LGARLGDFNSSTRQRGPAGSFLSRAEIRRITIERNGGKLAGGLEYPAVHTAIARFQKRLKIDRELQQKLKKVAKTLRIEI
jgi:hypothetical protein